MKQNFLYLQMLYNYYGSLHRQLRLQFVVLLFQFVPVKPTYRELQLMRTHAGHPENPRRTSSSKTFCLNSPSLNKFFSFSFSALRF